MLLHDDNKDILFIFNNVEAPWINSNFIFFLFLFNLAKFFLNFIGVCLHGVMIIISIKLFGIMMTSAVNSMATGGADAATNVSNLCYAMLLGGIVLVMACAKSGQWAKSILDAG